MIGELTPLQARAAVFIAAGNTDKAAAEYVGVKPATVQRWRRRLAFVEAIETETQRISDAIRAEGIANRQNRIDDANERHRLMKQVIAARAEANRRRRLKEGTDSIIYAEHDAAGAATGLMVLTVTYLKDGGRREEWAVDTGLLKEMREHEKQVAQDLGQWTEKRSNEITGADGRPVMITLDLGEPNADDDGDEDDSDPDSD